MWWPPSPTSWLARIASRAVKRAFDVVVAGSLIVITSPLWLIARLLLKRDSPGPVFYAARRVGRHGEPFTMYKFRTMVAGAAGPPVTASDDPRITRTGRWLRSTKLDELPQLLNVVRGEMSLVGPRPEEPRYVERYSAEQRRVLSVRPGVTSSASVEFRHEERLLTGMGADLEEHYLNVVLPAKLKLELDYLDHRSFGDDLGVLFATVKAVFRRRRSGG
jgi:lipopolysaccharide/colanic/teichoic acid biosynthesis glycosyltransferase